MGVLLGEDIRSGLRTTLIGRRIIALREVGSTNDLANEMAEKGVLEGTVVVAEAQTKGKGRLGRSWSSPPGLGLYTSIILHPPISPEQAPLFPLMAGIAVAEAVLDTTGLPTLLKWPNDVLLWKRKVAGILTELNADAGLVRHLVVGVGINVNQRLEDFPAELRDKATSLKIELGRDVSIIPLAQALYEKLEAWYLRFLKESSPPVLRRFEELCMNLGCRVGISSRRGLLEGIAVGVDSDGSLLLKLSTGSTVRVMAGEVTLRGETEI